MWRRFGAGVLSAFSLLILLSVVSSAFPVAVTGIVFEGLAEIEEKDLLEVVAFEVGDEVRESDLRSASQAIHDLGWFREVMPDVLDDGTIVFKVVEYPVIEEIEITGNVNKRLYRLFGIDLFRLPIMPTSTIKRILRDEEIRKGRVLNRARLETALMEVISEYGDRGYVLIAVGDVAMTDHLSIAIIEGRIAGNLVDGLRTVPNSVADEMIDLDLGEPLLQARVQQVMLALRDSVFFSNVDVVPQTAGTSDEVILSWSLTERELIAAPAEFERIALEGVSHFSLGTAEDSLGTIPSGPVDNYGLLQIVEGLYDLYQDAGYMMVRLSVSGIENGDLRLLVEEGEVSQILLSGNTRTRDYVVLRNLKIAVGDTLTWNVLAAAYQRLNSFAYFEAIEVLPEWSDDGVRLAIIITEKENLGGVNGALTVDPSSGGIIGELAVDQKNLFGTGQDISLTYNRGLAGGEDPMASSWTLGYSSIAHFPGFDRIGVDLYRNIQQTDDDETTSEYLTIGGMVGFDYPIADYTDMSLGYTHDEERLIDGDEWDSIDAVTLALNYDDTDDPLFPTAGAKRSLSIEQAGGFAVGEEYTKLGLVWTRFTPSPNLLFGDSDQVLAMRFLIGWGDADLTGTRLYKLGGPGTVRGADSVSVARVMVANIEHRLELTEGLVLAAFFDAGVDLGAVRIDNAVASGGFELGVSVAGVHLRLDFAWVFGEGLGWVPAFDFGFGPMF
ncbi:outer membrane protein assembly factor [Candidatus Bipolaricaulota bacterium]